MLRQIAVLLVAATSLVAQNSQAPTGISHHFKPGDTLRYTVTFEGDPNFDNVNISFQTGGVPSDQSGLTNNFGVGRSRRVAPGKFEVEGEVPNNVASGTYRLSSVQTRISPSGVKDYDASSFHEIFEIDNGTKYEFPPLKSVVPK
jgi:hypothetical protein